MSDHLSESTVAQLVAGELSPEQAERAHAHASECRDCERFVAELARVVVTAPAAAPTPDIAELARGASVGRFIVLERIGSGGMGVVHAAYDPELDRRVALKLLRSRRDADVRARLLREAQAAARLAHPNVVSVFEIGELADVVYLAMELVDGLTLSGWLRDERTWQDIVDMFAQAGHGLAAAHEAGVIHRDFKPDNVLVGRDGRARVVDFGLARGAESDEPEPPVALESAARSLSDRLTRTGALLGTPRYMAPEQLTSGEITPAADQFAFCVALYQALYGTVPFRGERIGEIADSVLANEIAPPVTSRGPLALRRAIVRGLAVDPARRHPSMPALLRELERAGGVRRRWTLAVAGVLGAAALAAGGFALAARLGGADACAGAGDRVGAVWSDARKARVHAAFSARKLPYGELAWRGVTARLDAYAAAWSAMRGDACEATRVRGEQSAQLLDLRMACLDERLAELDAFAGVLETADAETVQHAVDGAERLPALAPCADRAALAAAIRPPAAASAARVAQVGTAVTKASALERVGKRGPALAAAERACTGVEQLAYAPLTARCRHVVGALAESAAGDHARAAKLLSEAIAQAVAGNDHERAGDAALALARVLGDSDHRDEAERWLAVADGIGGRLADRTGLDAGLAELRGILAVRGGKPADALPQFEHLLALRERLDPKGGLAVANAHVSIGHALVALARYPEAERHYRRALAVIEEVSGAQHPNLCPVLDGLGQLAWSQGKAAEGLPYFERSLAITRATLPAGHPELVTALANLGAALANAGELDRALATLEEARSMVAAGDRAARALVLTNLVLVYQLRGDHARALPTAEQTLALERDLKGDTHPDTALAQFNYGDTLLSNGQPREAAIEFRGALAIWERVLPPDHPYLATAHTALRDAEQRSARQLGQRRDQRR